MKRLIPSIALTRFLRRRLLWILLTALAIVYLLSNLLRKNGAFNSDDMVVTRDRPLLWQRTTLQERQYEEASNRTNEASNTLHCRNSAQGRDLLVDDRGFVCARRHILPNACCDVEVPETLYYTCDTCNASTHCCAVYEYCVACCLQPNQRPLLEVVLSSIRGRQALLYAAVEDHFELCLVKCRTNSHSVEHENRYRNTAAKYCYGPTEAHESQREVAGSSAGS